MKTSRFFLPQLFCFVVVFILCRSLAAQEAPAKADGWNDEVQRIISEAEKRLQSTASGEAWDKEIQGALSEAVKRLKATSTGQSRADNIQGVLTKAAEQLQSVGTGEARLGQVQKILGEASSQLRGSGERLSANAGVHGGWNDEVQGILADAQKRMKLTSSGEAWNGEIQGALAEAAKRLKATSTGQSQADKIQGVLAKAAEQLQSVGTGEARLGQVQKILGEASSQLRGSGERLSANAGIHGGWNDEVQGVLSDAGKRLDLTASGEAWDNEIKRALTDAVKRLKATSTGQSRADDIQGILTTTAERLQSVGSGDARAAEVRKILADAQTQLRGNDERLSTTGAIHISQQTAPTENTPPLPEAKVTPIKGGYYVEWPTLADVGGVEIKGPMSGRLEISFDNRLQDVGAAAKPVDNPDVLLPLADFWIVRGKPERAIPLYERGLKAKPNDLLFQNNLAMILSSAMKDHDAALNVINGAMKNDQADNVTLLDTKGMILMNGNRADEAIPTLERAVELSCQRPIYVMHLARALDMVGRETHAKDWFNKVLPNLEAGANQLTPENKEIFDLLKNKYANAPKLD